MGDFSPHNEWVNQISKSIIGEESVDYIWTDLMHHITEPTREQAILNLVMSNEEGLIRDCVVKVP